MKTRVEEIDTNIYELKSTNTTLKKSIGLSEDIIKEISKEKDEPEWVLDLRLKALDYFNKLDNPNWGSDLSMLNIDEIATYVKPKVDNKRTWEEVPDDIKNIFDKLGIPEDEKKSLAGVGAQFDSEVVYHNIQDSLTKQGVIYVNFDVAIKEYPELIKEYFTKAVPIMDHKYIALHYALFSGGSFVYIPKGVNVDFPLQSYFRLNEKGAGQFEHTLIIVDEGATLEFIEGCSAPGYNELNLHAGCVELFVKKNAKLTFNNGNWMITDLNSNV